jgi:hypothetical protein
LKTTVRCRDILDPTSQCTFLIDQSQNIVGDDREETFLEQSGSSEDNEFDFAVGIIEEILMDEEFQSSQKKFCEEHCGE